MHHARYGLVLFLVLLLALATVVGIALMPADARIWLIPLLLAAAFGVRMLGWRN